MLTRPEYGYAIDTQSEAALLTINGVNVLIHPDILRHLANDLAAASSVYRVPGHRWGELTEQEKVLAFGSRLQQWAQQAKVPATRLTVGLMQQQNPHPLGLAHLPQTPPFSMHTIPISAETPAESGDRILSFTEVSEEADEP